MSEYDEHVSYLKKSHDRKSLLFILNAEIETLRDDLEEPGLPEYQTAMLRGSIGKIRELLDLLT